MKNLFLIVGLLAAMTAEAASVTFSIHIPLVVCIKPDGTEVSNRHRTISREELVDCQMITRFSQIVTPSVTKVGEVTTISAP